MKPKPEQNIRLATTTIECCHYCVAPKRYPGCHGKCPEYLAEKAAYEKRKMAYYGDRKVQAGLDEQRDNRITRIMKENLRRGRRKL